MYSVACNISADVFPLVFAFVGSCATGRCYHILFSGIWERFCDTAICPSRTRTTPSGGHFLFRPPGRPSASTRCPRWGLSLIGSTLIHSNLYVGYVERFIFETAKISQLFCHQIIWNMKANCYKGDAGEIVSRYDLD